MNLAQQKVLFFDCQTTGHAPPQAHMIEMGWAWWNQESAQMTQSSLVSLPDHIDLPERIAKMTGIKREELLIAPGKEVVWQRIFENSEIKGPFVIHFARFEKAFLAELIDVSTSAIFCTFEIARRLYPQLPSRSIRAVSGYLGHDHETLKRSAHHVDATRTIWAALVETLEQDLQIKTLSDLNTWLATKPEKSLPTHQKKRYCMSPEKRLALPLGPGVYKLLNAKGRVLYVGKATSLKSRVNSYFRGQQTKGSRLNEMTAQIADIEIIEVASPLQAAIIESDEIKSLNPPYNRALKKESREVIYCDHLFQRQDLPDAKPSLGPFPSFNLIEQVHGLRKALETGEGVTSLPMTVDEIVLNQGLQIFRHDLFKRDQEFLPPWRHILVQAWGRSIHKARQQRLLKEQEEDGDESELEVHDIQEQLEPEDVARYFNGLIAAFARRIHRGRWLKRLSSCQLYWRASSSELWKALKVDKGEIDFIPEEIELPHSLSISSDLTVFDLRTYDRLQVLCTEIKRLLRQNYQLRIFLGQNRILNDDQLKRFLFPGDFDEEN